MPIRVLLVGDADEARWLRTLLDSHGPSPFRVEQAPDLERAAEYIAKAAAEVVLLHIGADKSRSRKAVESAHAAVPRVPLIALSDVENEDQAIELLQSGAQDFLSKGRLTRAGVIRSLRYAIERHRLQKNLHSLSLLDDLTGLHNLRGFRALAEQHLRFIRRKGAALLVYLDLDNLKAVNDTFGHLEGNRALLETAVILRSCFRQADIVARMGGDEFCVLMTDARQDTAQEVRRRLEQRLEQANALPVRRYQLSLSVGIADVPVTSQPALEELLSLADALMYDQKRTKQARASVALSQKNIIHA
jgi:diguanylate cyclase (GGDEF)-like protein